MTHIVNLVESTRDREYRWKSRGSKEGRLVHEAFDSLLTAYLNPIRHRRAHLLLKRVSYLHTYSHVSSSLMSILVGVR